MNPQIDGPSITKAASETQNLRFEPGQSRPAAETGEQPGDASARDCDCELFLLAEDELEKGNPVGAAALLEHAIAINPAVAVYHAQLGRARALLGQTDDAIAAFRQAVALDARSADYQFQFGLALSRNGEVGPAIAALDRAVALNPGHAAAYHHLGRSLQRSGDTSNAIANYERAVFFDPGYADAHNDLGMAFMQMGALNAAAACFRHAIELAPVMPEAHLNLAHALADRGDGLAAIDELRKVVAFEPLPGNWAELGNALAAHGGAAEAAEICHRLARDRAGLKRLAADFYRELLRLQPVDEPDFIRAIEDLLLRAWTERCREGSGQGASEASAQR